MGEDVGQTCGSVLCSALVARSRGGLRTRTPVTLERMLDAWRVPFRHRLGTFAPQTLYPQFRKACADRLGFKHTLEAGPGERPSDADQDT